MGGDFGRILVLWALLGLLWAPPAGTALADAEGDAAADTGERWAVARGLTSDELGRLAQELGSPDAGRREAAYRALTDLHPESLPGIRERLRQLKRRRPSEEEARGELKAFRHAVGSRRADDEVDVAPGVLEALSKERTLARLAMAEPLLLLRALERMQEPAAGERIADIFMLDPPGVWSHEARMVRVRGGLSLLPHLIRLRSHEESRVRKWAQSAVRALGMDEPQAATRLDDRALAARVVAAYAEPLHFAAMPTLVRLVDSPSLQVRSAARAAVGRFGKNAIWQLREMYQEVASEPAKKAWNAERTAAELYRKLDGEQLGAAGALVEQGMKAFVAGDLATMAQRYDLLLARFPEYPERAKLAPGYAALGDARLLRDDLDGARDAFGRALRLDPKASDSGAWRGRLAFVDAERSLTRGVVDLPGYQRALGHDPELTAAARARDHVTGALQAKERQRRRLAAGGAILLLISFVAVLLRRPRDGSANPQQA